MIFDKTENLRLYAPMGKAFEVIADFVEKNDLKALECRRHELGDGIFANVSEYCPKAGDMPEAHRDYADLQLMVSGSEIIEVSPLDFCSGSTGYKPDIEFFAEYLNPTSVTLAEGTFAYLAPRDAHRPCVNNGCDSVKKIVFKIPLN